MVEAKEQEAPNPSKITFDGQSFQDMKKNQVETSRQKNGSVVTLKRLRTTQVGHRTYDCYFEEVVGPDGKKKLTLIMRDEDDVEFLRKELDPSFSADNYECYLD